MRIPTVPFVGAAAAFLIVLLGAFEVRESAKNDIHDAERESAITRLSLVAATLSQTVNVRLNHTRSLAAFVKAKPDFDQDDFDAFTSVLQGDLIGLRSLQLQPGGVITYLTNLEENRQALGHDLFADPLRRPMVERSVENREYIIAGPIDLVQGDKAIVARRPIFNNADDSFWGFATVLIDVGPLLMDAGYLELEKQLKLAIRGQDGLGAAGEVFVGSGEVFDNPLAVADVILPGGSWQIGAALPDDHSYRGFIFTDSYWFAAVIAALLSGWAVFVVADRPGRLKAEVERATADLIEARDAAEAANQAKTEFVSVVSHELRTPLTAIKGGLELMEAGALGKLPEKAGDVITVASRNCKRLMLLVNDILDMSKLLSGEMRMAEDAIAVGSLLADAVAINKPYADNFGVELTVNSENSPVANLSIRGDKERLDQVLANLISNAAKFSPEGGTVTLAASPTITKDMVTITVTDTGPGIPEDFQDRVFDRFTQADTSDTRKSGGTGLGLYISKLIIDQHGGDIGFRTETGAGTTFHIDLPIYGDRSE